MSRSPKVDPDVLAEAYKEAAKQAVTLKQREWCNTRKTY